MTGHRGGPGWPKLVAVVLALAVAGVAVGLLADYERDRVVDYRSPYRFNLEPGRETPPLTDRLILFIVDGLRVDVARTLPTFQAGAEDGSFLVARTAEPSLSLPGWTQLVTGAPPEISGVTTNSYEGRVHVDSLFNAAERRNLETAIVGSRGWRDLFGDEVDLSAYARDDDDEAVSDARLGRAAVRIAEEESPDFMVVHLPDVDHRGHQLGVGEAYREAARGADRIIAEVLEAAPADTTAILTSDHGHVDEGGHGGTEEEVTRTPLVLSGPGLVPGARGEVGQADVAPTIAALLGLSRPVHAVGELRTALLDTDDQTRAGIEKAHEETAARFFGRAAAVIGGRAVSADTFREAREDKAARDVLARLPIALAALVILSIAVVLASQRLDGLAVFVGVLVFFGAWAGLFFGRGLTLSLSHLNTEDQIQSFLLVRILDAILAGLAAGVVTGLAAGRRGRSVGFPTGLGTVAWSMLIAGFGVGGFLAIYGWAFTWRLPNLPAAFAQYLALLAIFALGVGAAIFGLAAEGASRLTRPRGSTAGHPDEGLGGSAPAPERTP